MMGGSDPKRNRNMGRTHLVLDQDVVFLTREKLRKIRGNDNVSQFVNEVLEEFVIEERGGPDPVRQEIERIASTKRKELLAQRKLFHDEISSQQKAETYRMNRDLAIEQAAVRVFLKHRDFSRYLPDNDQFGDLSDRFHRAVTEISQLAGYDVDPAEVIRIYQQKTGAWPVSKGDLS